jgi:hypothetical protein
MKALFAAVVLTAFGQAAQADPALTPATAPVELTDAQMDQVTAGGADALGLLDSSGQYIGSYGDLIGTRLQLKGEDEPDLATVR